MCVLCYMLDILKSLTNCSPERQLLPERDLPTVLLTLSKGNRKLCSEQLLLQADWRHCKQSAGKGTKDSFGPVLAMEGMELCPSGC